MTACVRNSVTQNHRCRPCTLRQMYSRVLRMVCRKICASVCSCECVSTGLCGLTILATTSYTTSCNLNNDYHKQFSSLWRHDWQAFSRPYGHLAPFTSHSSSVLFIPNLNRPTTEAVLLSFLVIFSPQLYPARWCLPGFPSLSPHVQPI